MTTRSASFERRKSATQRQPLASTRADRRPCRVAPASLPWCCRPSVEHEQILRRIECVERLEQHLPLRAVGRMQTGVQREFGARQKQGKRVVVRRQCGRLACRHTQARRISRHHAAAIPAMPPLCAGAPCSRCALANSNSRPENPAGLAEACALTSRIRPAPHAGDRKRRRVRRTLAHMPGSSWPRARQGELAIAGEGPAEDVPARPARGRAESQRTRTAATRGRVFEFILSVINDLTNAILPVSHRVHKAIS